MSLHSNIDFCVLIPCYNNFGGLVTSISSIIYKGGRFMVLVVDDGSRERVDQLTLHRALFMEYDVVVIRNETNIGITRTLNRGLEWIRVNTDAPYTARLDCGDTCDGNRFTEQLRAFNADPELGLIGSWCWFMDPDTGQGYKYITPTSHEEIMEEMNFRNVFIHPTVMFRMTLLQKTGDYPEGYELAEDYAFCWKLMLAAKTCILDQFLVTCEINKKGLSFANKGKQLLAKWKVIRTLGNRPNLRLRSFLRLSVLFITPKGLILWIKKRKPS